MTIRYHIGLRLLAAIPIALAACSSDEIEAPTPAAEGSLTVDASAGWAYVSLGDESLVQVADPATSTGWDIAFNATRVMLNGGAAGPGGVEGSCLCQNAAATDEQVLGFTAESEQADFEAVSAAQIPPAEAFETEALVPAIQGWESGTGATWLVRLHDGVAHAKLRVLPLTTPTGEHAGPVTLEWAVQPAADQPLGPVQTATLDAAAATRLELSTGSITPAADAWDLELEGFTIRLNGGVSGGGAAAAATTTEDFTAITTAVTDPRAYQQDAFAGVFNSHPWYRYNLTGENIIHPTFDVYVIRRGSAAYKVQLVNYYGSAGEPRRITIRYALLTE